MLRRGIKLVLLVACSAFIESLAGVKPSVVDLGESMPVESL